MTYPKFTDKVLCQEMDPDLFFESEDKNSYLQLRLVKQVCFNCPSQQTCLDYAVQHDVHGVWGGTTQHERRTYQRRNGIVPIPLITGATA